MKRTGWMALLLSLALVACGGGGGSPGAVPPHLSNGGSSGGTGSGTGTGGTTAPGGGTGGGTGTTAPGGDFGEGDGGSGGNGGGDGGLSDGVAGGVGSGGTGISGDGVGSGGTGIGVASASVGSVDALGSVWVNGVRHLTDRATLDLRDASTLQRGMTVRVDGTVSPSASAGTASRVSSAADLVGVVQSVESGGAVLRVLGQQVLLDSETVLDGYSARDALAAGHRVRVWGLPGGGGALRATRVQRLSLAPEELVVSGLVDGLSTGARTLQVGDLAVSYAEAAPSATPALRKGMVVRLRGQLRGNTGVFHAREVEDWYGLASLPEQATALAGVVTDWVALQDFRLGGVRVNARDAQVTGGRAESLVNGAKIEVTGVLRQGVLEASRVRIRVLPGTGGPSSLVLQGSVGLFVSPADFRVQGQPVNASGAGVRFVNGTVADLRNGKPVRVEGERVVDGVLIADLVTF